MSTVTSVLVALNEDGRRIGETHHRARITDSMVEQIRDLHEYDGKTPRQIAASLGLTFRTVKKICDYERRVQVPHSWRRVPVMPAPIS